MNRQAAAGGPASAGPSGALSGSVPARTVRDRFIALVRGASDLSDDERERVLDLGLTALRGDTGLGGV